VSRTLRTGAGDFTADVAGPESGAVVLLLHGFPQSRHAWRAQLPALAAAGYRAVAPDQRGYSPGARPDPARDLLAYGIDHVVRDALEIADAARPGGAGRFHVVGHDWGGQVAWALAGRHPERVASLTVLSRPHPAAFRRAYEANVGDQQQRSRHHRAFQDPATARILLEDDARRLRSVLSEQAVPPAAVAEYLVVLGEPAALEAALAWYRAAGTLAAVEVPKVAVPTLYVWGDRDATVGRAPAEWTAEYVAAPYRFEVLPGVGHFVTDEAPERASALLLDWLARFPA
jgi:pimeloyl-ACP methyl ester carboxylesterase